MKSVVELNSTKVYNGQSLVFYGDGWSESWIVIDHDKTSMTVTNEIGDENTYTYKELQVGWDFA